MAKSKKEEKTELYQIIFAIVGALVGLLLGYGISYFLFKDKPIEPNYKLLFSALIMMGNAIVPGYIGFYGGEAPDTIESNIFYYLALLSLITFLIFDLKVVGILDSCVLGITFSLVFLISIKFGLKEDGSFSLFWIPILIIFGIIIALYYYFGYFAHVLKNIEKQWDEYDPDINTNKEKDSSLQKGGGINDAAVEPVAPVASEAAPVAAPEAAPDEAAPDEAAPDVRASILIFDIESIYKAVIDALFKIINPKTTPNIVPDVKKAEDLENKYEGMGRRYIIMGIAAALLVVTVISAIVFFIVVAVSKPVAVSPSNLFTSKLIINLWLLCVITIALVLIKFGINYGIKKYVPQAEPDNLLNEINKLNDGDIKRIINNSQHTFQMGGGKIEKPDKKTSNKNEKGMYLSLKI
jgi:succinate dehydrogenase hydrophobic anchor subunit